MLHTCSSQCNDIKYFLAILDTLILLCLKYRKDSIYTEEDTFLFRKIGKLQNARVLLFTKNDRCMHR